MTILKFFDKFIEEGIVKKVSIDKERAKSLILESERRFLSLKERIEKLGIKDENANDYVEYCYDTIMPLLRAKLCIEGYSTSGQGAHEAEISYLRILNFSDKEIQFANQLRFFRNGILYYGTVFDEEYAKKVIDFTKQICPKLKNFLKEF